MNSLWKIFVTGHPATICIYLVAAAISAVLDLRPAFMFDIIFAGANIWSYCFQQRRNSEKDTP